MNAQEVIAILKPYRFTYTDEKDLQLKIAAIFKKENIPFRREVDLDEYSCPDFMMEDGLCVEVKIKSSARRIYDQCLRYCQIDEVKSLLLVTSKTMGLPATINNKPAYILNISRAWL